MYAYTFKATEIKLNQLSRITSLIVLPPPGIDASMIYHNVYTVPVMPLYYGVYVGPTI